jgi:CBS domain-containing protein
MNPSISVLLEYKGPTVFSVPPSLTVADTVHEMNRHRVGCVVVMDAGRLAGIFTERDVLTRVIAVDLDPRTHTVGEVMTRNVLTIKPETTVDEAIEIFTQNRCRHLPVVVGGQVAGLISIGDTTRWLAEAHRHEAEQLKQYISGGYPT